VTALFVLQFTFQEWTLRSQTLSTWHRKHPPHSQRSYACILPTNLNQYIIPMTQSSPPPKRTTYQRISRDFSRNMIAGAVSRTLRCSGARIAPKSLVFQVVQLYHCRIRQLLSTHDLPHPPLPPRSNPMPRRLREAISSVTS
jgi:hypothetical protein